MSVAATCGNATCTSPRKPAVWVPVMVFTHVKPHVRMRVPARLCCDCRDASATDRSVLQKLYQVDLGVVTREWPREFCDPPKRMADIAIDFDLVEVDEDVIAGQWSRGCEGWVA